MTAAELVNLTPEQKRVKIAEACGWTHLRYAGKILWGCVPNYKERWSPGCYGDRTSVPNYLSDLNAMHEAEKGLRPDQYKDYCVAICEVCDQTETNTVGDNATCIVFATAAQRAEAFLLTI